MAPWPFSDDDLRRMYAGGRGNPTAKRFARFWAAVQGMGLMPPRWVTLEVRGRKSGQTTRFPLGMADSQGQWFLVSMLGESCNWVQNVRAADGRATLQRRRRRDVHLVEVPVAERAPIIKRYLEKVPGGRPHISVDRNAPVNEFGAIADRYPVFRVEPRANGARGQAPASGASGA
jgi:deazaflavin-dependent oxidoreductase (nitroreductase family)